MSGWGAIYRSASTSLRAHAKILADLQEQAAAGRRVIRGSDDPGDANRILHLRSESRSLGSYIENLDSVVTSLEQISVSLESTSAALVRVDQLLTQAASETLLPESRKPLADEIDGLLEQIVNESNQKSLGRYLFSGHSTTTQSFSVQRTAGTISSVRYQGARNNLPVPVAAGVEYSGLMVGSEVFAADRRSAPEFLGGTGAAAGAGTSSVTGDLYLTVAHDDTVFQGAAHGLAKGDSADTADTIVGVHTLTIGFGTLQLGQGPVASFDPGDTDVQVRTANGDVMYVDVSGWDNVPADITVVGQAKLYLNDPAVATTVTDFSSDVAVLDANGKVLHVDPSGIFHSGTGSGVEPVVVTGTHDVFGALINIRDLMLDTRDLTEAEQSALLSRSIDSLRGAADAVRNSATVVGSRLQAMDSLRTSLDNIQFTTDSEADALESADIVQIAVDLARTQTLYEMTLASTAKLLSLSLLDYL